MLRMSREYPPWGWGRDRLSAQLKLEYISISGPTVQGTSRCWKHHSKHR
jgi:hypothetical protein